MSIQSPLVTSEVAEGVGVIRLTDPTRRNALSAAPVPTIAAVATPAIGAGVNLPLACDIILAAPGARFDPRWLDVGIHPGGGHLYRLAERIGPQGAAAL